MSDISNGKKDIYVKYLDVLRPLIYQEILTSNRDLVHILYKKKLGNGLKGYPLWLLHGGELINLYSDDKHKVPTKDIDIKLYFTGSYSIPPKIFNQAIGYLPKINISKINFYDDNVFHKKESTIIKKFKSYLQKQKIPCYQIWSIGERQKIDICVSLVEDRFKGIFSQLNLKTGKLKEGYEVEDLLDDTKCGSQQWINGDQCKAFIVNIPYITQVGRNNVPYDINDKVLYQMGTDYDEEIDGYYIDEDIVRSIGGKVKDWLEDPRLPTTKEKREYLRKKLWMIRLTNQKFKLSSVIGVTIVYNKTRGQWYLFQEGILDVYIDYCAGHHHSKEKEYLGRYEDGSFPSVIKRVNHGKQASLLKVPSLPWLIYDQLRMLYITLRGSYLGCDEKTCKWVPLGGGAVGNSDKYFNKLQGLLKSFGILIQHLQEGDLPQAQGLLTQCKGSDLEKCGPLSFITELFENFELDILKGTVKKTKKAQRLKRSSKKDQRSKRSSKRSSKSPTMIQTMIMKNEGKLL